MGKSLSTVVGCGVIGLSSGIRLLEAGFEVTIIARDLPPNTTSNVAAAFWYPYEAYPLERALAWGKQSLNEFYRLAALGDCGISLLKLREVYTHPVDVPWWKDLLPAAEALPPADLPPGSVAGYLLEVPLMEMPVYMPYLLQRFHQLGGQIEQRAINTLSDITYPDRIIINCTGVWARQVANDPSVFPLRGQVLKVNAPHIKTGFLGEGGDEDTLTYIVPRRDGCILGGTAQKDNWNLAADPHIAKAIRARCAAVEPSLQTAEVLSQAVGLRPGRHEVRLEVERMADSCIIIHNYGHGGAGVTLSWGCADEVVTLALSVLPEMNQS